MGNSKLLIIAISVLSALALICVSAFAEDFTPEFNFPPFEEGERVDVEDVVRDVGTGTDTSVPYNIFDQSYYLYRGYNFNEIPNNFNSALDIYTVSAYLDGVFLGGFSGNLVKFNVDSGNVNGQYFYGFRINSVFYPLVSSSSDANRITFDFTSPSSTLQMRGGVAALGDLVEVEPVNDLWDTIRGVGNSIITFVMSSWVVLVPVVAFVLVLGITVIRRLTNGV